MEKLFAFTKLWRLAVIAPGGSKLGGQPSVTVVMLKKLFDSYLRI